MPFPERIVILGVPATFHRRAQAATPSIDQQLGQEAARVDKQSSRQELTFTARAGVQEQATSLGISKCSSLAALWAVRPMRLCC
jgi:hypothetical protein